MFTGKLLNSPREALGLLMQYLFIIIVCPMDMVLRQRVSSISKQLANLQHSGKISTTTAPTNSSIGHTA